LKFAVVSNPPFTFTRGFHKILKSGCRAESARLRTAERLVRLVAVFCILSWRVFWMTMLNRTGGGAPA